MQNLAEHQLSDLEVMNAQIDAQFTHDPAGRIIAENEPDGDGEPAPRFVLGRTREGSAWRVRFDVPGYVARQLEAIVMAEPVPSDLDAPPLHLEAILDALWLDREPTIGHHGPSYRFPKSIPVLSGVTRITRENLHLLHRMVGRIDALDRDFDHVEPWMAMVIDGAAVSTCFSVRLNDRAAGARVDTLVDYRGRGYAPAVVAAWARAVRETGRIPGYGTSWDNTASQAVARKLGLVKFGAGLNIE